MSRLPVRPTVLVVAVAAILLGLAAEVTASGWRNPAAWVPDLIVGWTLIGAGAVAWGIRRDSRTGLLLALSGLAWFVPNFAPIDIAPIPWLATHGTRLHQGPLVHAIMTFPTGRTSSGSERGIVAAGYLIAILPGLPVPASALLATEAILGALLIGGAALRTVTAFGPTRRARAWAVPPATAVGLTLIGIAAGRLITPSTTVSSIQLVVYQVVLCVVAIWLTAGLHREPWRQAAVTNLVVELGDGRASSVQAALALALGDPTLEVGYAIDGTAGYRDAQGRALPLPPPGAGRVATPIDVEGRPVGILVHDPAVLDDPGLGRSIAEAADLAASNARLQGDVRSQIADVEASRARLVRAEDDERRRIQVTLQEGTEARLRTVSESLAEVQRLGEAAHDGKTLEHVFRAARQLEDVLDDLRDLAQGLHPAIVQAAGLRAAMVDMAQRAALPVEVDAPPADVPLHAASTAYYVCAEGLANVVKHAQATRAVLRSHVRGSTLLIEVEDDGVGGADPSGSGLRGLADRVEAFGGSLTVDSRPGIGTRLAAELPLDGEA